MDAFEEVVAEMFRRNGYWVQQSFKVELTKDEKKKIGKPSLPRTEIDLIAYKAKTSELLLIECKSYLNSGGVSHTAFDGTDKKSAKRYKLFNDKKLFKVVSEHLVKQLSENGACPDNVVPKLCLVAGHIKEKSRTPLTKRFDEKEWELWDETKLKEELEKIGKSDYENSVVAVTAKLLRDKEKK